MPTKQYHDFHALSSSGIKQLKISPAHFKAWRTKEHEETPALRLGTLVHLMLLEPERAKTDIVCWSGKVKNGKVWDAFEAANAGKLIIKPSEMNQAVAMLASIRSNQFVNRALSGGRAELEYYGLDPVFQCPVKCCFDYITPNLILDPKKTAGTVKKFIERSIWDYDYHIQAAWYSDLAFQMDGIERKFAWIVVEDFAPYACQLVVPTDEMLEIGRETYLKALETFAFCNERDIWPGYSSEIIQASVPEWMKRKLG